MPENKPEKKGKMLHACLWRNKETECYIVSLFFFHERSVSTVYPYPTVVDVPEKQRLPPNNRYCKWHIGITTYLCAMRKLVALLVRYFFQGIIIISPIAVTAYAAYSIFDFVDSKIPNLPRGLGFLLVIASLIVLGWMASTFFAWKFLIGFLRKEIAEIRRKNHLSHFFRLLLLI